MDLDLQGVDVSIRPTPRPSLSDLHFLANFIVSAYLGPDVKSENPRRSALQRVAEGLPEDRLQFTSFFPLHLHEQTSFLRGLNIVKGIVIISEPDISYMKHDELERFRYLSGMDSLNIDINESQRYQHRHWAGREEIGRNFSTISEGPYAGHASNLNSISPFMVQDEFKRRRLHEPLEMPVVQLVPSVLHGSQRPCNLDGPSMIPLLSIPNAEECKSEASIVLTGVAREVSAGPPIGRVDIGVSKTAYFFRVALPGVRKDNCNFGCEVENDGKVLIRGSTSTGGRTIVKHPRVFEMKLQQLCPPGPFTITFRLPGPVDPRLFKANFRADGIFEGIIVKSEDMD